MKALTNIERSDCFFVCSGILSGGNIQPTGALRLPVTPPKKQLRQAGEGLDVDTDAAVTLRDERVDFIITKVDFEGSVLVRSPPMSGKSSMCSLISRKLRESGRKVVHVSMLCLGIQQMLTDPSAAWNKFWMKYTDHPVEYWIELGYTIIVDETQMLYQFASVLPEFWLSVKATMSNQSPTSVKFILFSAYSERNTSGAGLAC
jgi:hypothetical protein